MRAELIARERRQAQRAKPYRGWDSFAGMSSNVILDRVLFGCAYCCITVLGLTLGITTGLIIEWAAGRFEAHAFIGAILVFVVQWIESRCGAHAHPARDPYNSHMSGG